MEICNTTVGIDLGDKTSDVCVLDGAGEVEEKSTIKTTKAAMARYFRGRPTARVVFEVGTHSGWLSRELSTLGNEVLVADPRTVRYLAGGGDKDDELDAEFLARVGRADPRLLKPVRHREESTQAMLAVIRTRDSLVQARTQLINHVRGMVKTFGERMPSCSADRFHKLADALPEVLQEPHIPVMQMIGSLTEQIRAYDKQIEAEAQKDPAASLLREIAGVGALTALTYVLVIEDPVRFQRSRTVGAYLGFCRRRYQSGNMDRELGISKRGDVLLRRLLVTSAHYILGPFGPDSDLRRWGLSHIGSGGKNKKKRAIVAVARKLAVLMHRLWTTGEVYDPLFASRQTA